VSDPSLVNTVRRRRAAAGLTQAQLAAEAGVSRQALSAIEAGRQVPSTALALQLARALRCDVGELFRLAGGDRERVRVAAGGPPASRRVVPGSVDGRCVAHRLGRDSRTADGLLTGPVQANGTAWVDPLVSSAAIDANVLVAGCAPLLGLLADRLGRRFHDARATWIRADSGQALQLLRRGEVHIAGLHLASADDPDAHVRAAQQAVAGGSTLIHLARWRQGLVVAPGNPLGIDGRADLARPSLRWVHRPAGSGAQRLLERVLAEVGAAPPLPSPTGHDHGEVARMVRWGVADVGVAIESAAVDQGLAFVPLADERFDLVVPTHRLDEPAVARFLDQLAGAPVRREAGQLVGYDLAHIGEAHAVPRAAS